MAARRGLTDLLGRPAPTRRQLLLGGGHLAALWALAFVQPLLDLLGNNPDFFVARGNSAGDILILAIGFTLLPPLGLWLVELLVSRLSTRAYHGLHFLLLASIAAFLFVGPVSDLLAARSALILLFSLLIGALLAWATFRFVFVKNLMDILILAPLIILVLFVFTSKTSEVIFPEESDFALAAESGDDHPIVLIVYDELGTANLMTSQDEIDGSRFPNFARLAATGTWYRNHSTTSFFTPRAVPGILTGIDQPADTLPTSQQQPLSIFSQFGRERPLHVLEPVTAICPEEVCPDEEREQSQPTRLRDLFSDLKYVEGKLVLPPGLADKLPDVSSNFEDFGDGGDEARQRRGRLFVKGQGRSDPERYEDFIRRIPVSERGLTVMHMHLPHQVWKLDTKGFEYNDTPIKQLSRNIGPWLVNSNGIASAQARMYVQTGYADLLLGQIRRKLESEGLWDKAMVVVTSDHGISFEGGDVPQRQTDRRAMGEVANAPLLIKYPGQRRGAVSLKPSRTLDIVPTIARAVGVQDLYETDGVPLQGPVPQRDVTVTDPQGESLSVPLQEMVRQREAAIARANERLGTGPFYTLGPAPELIGRRVAPVPPGTDEARLDEPYLARAYDPGIALVPMFVTGIWEEDLPAAPEAAPVFAVAINGVIRGTARPFEFEGATRFGTLVDPDSLHRGSNRIDIYRVEGRRLVPLGSNS